MVATHLIKYYKSHYSLFKNSIKNTIGWCFCLIGFHGDIMVTFFNKERALSMVASIGLYGGQSSKKTLTKQLCMV